MIFEKVNNSITSYFMLKYDCNHHCNEKFSTSYFYVSTARDVSFV